MTKIAAVLSLFLGFGFGLPCIGAIRHFARTGEVWTFMGFPTYGGGPFEDAGIPTSTPLLSAFLIVCVAEVALALLIWRRRQGWHLSLLLLPFEMLFWIGFSLPFGPPLGIARTALLLAAKEQVYEKRLPN